MIDPRLLEAATTRGIIAPDQAQALGALAAELAAVDGEPLDRERLRFVTGFSDIFVTIGIGLFVGAFFYFAAMSTSQAVAWVLVAFLAWGLAEIFTRRRRQALPSIVLLGVFAVAVFSASNWIVALLLGGPTGLDGSRAIGGVFTDVLGLTSDPVPAVVAISSALTAALVGVHYLRFGVPITVAVGVASLALLALAVLDAIAPGFVEAALVWLVLALGVVVFALAMRFDLSDPERVTRRTDIAFWLHLLAAPMIVHPLVGPMIGDGTLDIAGAAAVIALFLALGAVAVVIDRRAMLVSGLVYAGIAVSTLAEGLGFYDEILPLTLLFLGAFVLVLSVGWVRLRGAIVRLLPGDLSRRLPRPVG